MSSSTYKRAQRAARLTEVNKIKTDAGCADGLYCNPAVALSPTMLECDHLPGFTKLGNVSNMVNDLSISMEAILVEIGKCDIVCKLCHQARTDQRRKG